MDLTVAPPTPPTTQALASPPQLQGGSWRGALPMRHPEFYYIDPTLMDPVILQVCRLLSAVSFLYADELD